MMFPTIAWRELRVKARQEKVFIQRVLLAAGAVGVVVIMLVLFEVTQTLRGMGQLMFGIMGWLSLILGALESLRLTVDSLSVEKREGTLGLLFLTPLSSLDVVLGKWVVHALSAFYQVLAIFPALAIPFVLGGVTAGEFVRLLLALGNMLFFGLALGMAVSAWGWEENEVWAAGLSWLGLIMAAPFLAELMLASTQWSSLGTALTLLSPLKPWLQTPYNAYSAAPGLFWNALGVTHLLGWMLLALSAWSMARVWKKMTLATPPQGGGRLEQLARPLVRGLHWLDQKLWQDFLGFTPSSATARFLQNRHLPPGLLLGLLAGGMVGCAVGWQYQGTSTGMVFLAVGIFYLLHWVVRFWAASQSCQIIPQLRQSGWLTTLCIAPMHWHELPKALLQSQRPAHRMVFALLMAMELVGIAGLLLATPNFWLSPILQLNSLWLAGALILWADLCALNNAGLWYSLNLSQPAAATRRTLWRVLILPLLVTPLAIVGLFILLPIFFILKSLFFYNLTGERLVRKFRLGIEEMQRLEPASGTETMLRLLNLKKTPPLLPGTGPRCVACGHGVGNADYCPLCGYRQPSSETWP